MSHFRSQAKGTYGIPQLVVARALPVLIPYLTRLFDASLSQGIFPSSWKKARISALKESTVTSSPSDFRPIALLFVLSKVHSTQSALLKLTYDIGIDKEKKLATLLLQFDFS